MQVFSNLTDLVAFTVSKIAIVVSLKTDTLYILYHNSIKNIEGWGEE